MADGSVAFNFPLPQRSKLRHGEIVVDLFAGGGGASHALETALARAVDIGWLHASPDCTHFSQAKGGQPRNRATRSLSWVVLRWAGAVRALAMANLDRAPIPLAVGA
ncbi:MAG: hypothetical protein LBL59_07295 [Xanthomonadaceae bacterium]|jgi:DNA (cytosine-5)-methyltransferase 1|nr:hypothetical protein [Xanthomonadaceae bacterium]